MTDKYSVCIIGEGKWSCAVIKIVARNASRIEELEDKVTLFNYDFYKTEEEKLRDDDAYSEASSCYELGDLPSNVIAYTDMTQAARNADIIIFCLSLKTLNDSCDKLLDRIKPSAFAIFFVRETIFNANGEMELGSEIIYRKLNIRCSKIVGSDLASHLMRDEFCEGIIACHDVRYAKILLDLFRSETFRVNVADDQDTIEIWAKLKHIIGFAFGMISGLRYGESAKAGVLRMGFQESFMFLDTFYPGGKLATFFETCGISDIVRECFLRKEPKIAEEFVKSRKNFQRLELEILGSKKNTSIDCAKGVYNMLHKKSMDAEFPLFVAVYKICVGELPPEYLKDVLRNSTTEIYHPVNTLPL